jgi:hypothetical protein
MEPGSVAQVNLHYYAILNMGIAAALFWDSFFGFGFNIDIFTEARVRALSSRSLFALYPVLLTVDSAAVSQYYTALT